MQSARPRAQAARKPAAFSAAWLVHGDNEDAADSLAILLQMAGHDTVVATDGAQAVAKAAEFLPDVAILDIGMPTLDGLAAAAAIRSSASGNEVLLVALSGFGLESDTRRSKEAGFDHHPVKPVDVAQIEAVLRLRHRDR